MRGFSLAELLVTMAILIGLLLAIFNLLPGALLAVADAQDQLAASTVAQAVLEQERMLPGNQLANGVNAFPTTANGFTPTVTITRPSTDQKLVDISVDVAWQNKIGPHLITRELQIYTLQ